MIFVCPLPGKSVEIPNYCRLYAFPREPDPPPQRGFVILDSGAFGLFERGLRIGLRHMFALADYYRPYVGQGGYHCVAPDVFLHPVQTMWNWKWWQENIGLPVVPVIQFSKKGCIDFYLAMRQAQYYAGWSPRFVAISNPSLRASESEAIRSVCAVVREITGAEWLHYLGAGWSPGDIRGWRDMGVFDSIDSIAYYTAAHEGQLWRRDGKWEYSSRPSEELMVENARVAVEIARGG